MIKHLSLIVGNARDMKAFTHKKTNEFEGIGHLFFGEVGIGEWESGGLKKVFQMPICIKYLKIYKIEFILLFYSLFWKYSNYFNNLILKDQKHPFSLQSS
ncbi:Mobile element protein [Methanosarcina siciliae C2J]|uniref:Mobile element protein n=1 Tax=Methanosarcina siciliae C2J TaxID=1434118 RepID=A0A0E3PNR8_9EURY|nr:hypothetical protein [Methanosarcina siciliae]AKB36837.1 Mobile element protein [Methanosarcina siciliae C2J]